MSYQDGIDSEERQCKCGLEVCLNTECPSYDDLDIVFDAEYCPLILLWDKVDEQIKVYQKMKPSKDRNKFRHAVSRLVKIANERGIKTNKIAPYKTIWW